MTFAPGQRVRVATRTPRGHHRTPGYVKGKAGTVARLHGKFTNPETRAHGGDGLPRQELYLVAFDEGGFRLYVDVFEHWLEEAE